MREYELEVLEQYHIDVESTRKIRGAFFCDTDLGVMVLREMRVSEQRALYFYMICKHLEESGYANVDTIMPTAEGTFLSTSRDGRHYVLKKWYPGNECDVKNERDILSAVRNLAQLHRMLHWHDMCELEGKEPVVPPCGGNLQDIFARHNQELKKVRKYVRSQPVKHEFEELFLKNFDQMHEQAAAATEKLKESGYGRLYQEALENRTLVHGDYNYHNIILMKNEIATTNFEKARLDIQISDFVYFMRKVMEKQRWKPELGRKMLAAYTQVRPLSDAEKEYICIRLSYPEKFWKTVNHYYLSSKSWIPVKMVEKLQQTITETAEKRSFLEKIFTFLL
ncbi:MAG: CotS family spore coat protein [Hespellia sp.]|nr:CotS family spore coat protein [Hespellia sp.]